MIGPRLVSLIATATISISGAQDDQARGCTDDIDRALDDEPIAVGRHLHRHECAVALGVVPGKRNRALEQIGAVLRLDTRAFAHADRVLNLLIAGLDRQRNDDLVDHLAHQDLLELLESADRLLRNQVVCGGTVRRFVHEADHFVAMLPVMADLCVGALGQTTRADNEGSAHVPVARTIHRSPAGSHQETEGERGQPEMRHLPHRQAAAHARQRKGERQSGSSGGGGDQTTDLGSEAAEDVGPRRGRTGERQPARRSRGR